MRRRCTILLLLFFLAWDVVVNGTPVSRSKNILRNWREQAKKRGEQKEGVVTIVGGEAAIIDGGSGDNSGAPALSIPIEDSNSRDSKFKERQTPASLPLPWPESIVPKRPRTKMMTMSTVQRGSKPIRGEMQIRTGKGMLDSIHSHGGHQPQQLSHGTSQLGKSSRPRLRQSLPRRREGKEAPPIDSSAEEEEGESDDEGRMSRVSGQGESDSEYDMDGGGDHLNSEGSSEEEYDNGEEEEEDDDDDDDEEEGSSSEIQRKGKTAVASTAQSRRRRRRRRRRPTHAGGGGEGELDEDSDDDDDSPSRIFRKAFDEKGLNVQMHPAVLAEGVRGLRAGDLNRVSIGSQAARYIQKRGGPEYYSRYHYHMNQMHSRLYEVMKYMRKREPGLSKKALRKKANEVMLREMRRLRGQEHGDEGPPKEMNDDVQDQLRYGRGSKNNNGRPRDESIAGAGTLLERALLWHGYNMNDITGEQLASVVIDMTPGKSGESIQAFRRKLGFYITDHEGMTEARRNAFSREMRRLVRRRLREWRNEHGE